MSNLYGAQPLDIPRFGGGLVLDLDPAELDPDQASDALNVDLDDHTLAKRLGKEAVGAAAAVGRVRGLHGYYPKDGAARRILAQIGTAIYDEGGTGTFSSVVAALTGGRPMDFLGWKDTIYAGNGVDAVRRRDGAGVWSTVANYLAPVAAPALAGSVAQVETFDSGVWTLAGAALTTSYVTDVQRDGTALKLKATAAGARGSYIHKAFSSGATVDLSGLEYLVLWVYGNKPGPSFSVAIYQNGETRGVSVPAFALFPTFAIRRRKTWFPIRIPLGSIPPANRTASPGLAIRFVDDGGRGFSPDLELTFDDCRGQGPLVDDSYQYWTTYRNSAADKESAPSPAGTFLLQTLGEGKTPVQGIGVTATGILAAGVNAGIDQIRVWRYRATGPFSRARLVKTLANPGATTSAFVDTLGDGELAETDAEELVRSRLDPPLARSYALVNSRLVCGGVTLSGTPYPWRLYVSRLGFPEQFSEDERPSIDPNAAGWFDIGTGDHIQRVMDFDGMCLIFCDRSIWTLQGSGWDDFSLQKRADIGLTAREAVCVWGRLVFFLAEDGLRVLAPNESFDLAFETWPVSEPVGSRIRAIPDAYRGDCALGLDERQRLHLSIVRSGQTVSDAALIFDPRRPGAIAPGPNPKRPGWTYYDTWGASCFLTLKRGGGDGGELLAGDPATGRVWRLHRTAAGVDLHADDGAAITWHWQSRQHDAGPGRTHHWRYVGGTYDPTGNQAILFTPILDGIASATTYSQLQGAAVAGIAKPAEKRCGPVTRARYSQLKIGGSHSAAIRVRSVSVGVNRR